MQLGEKELTARIFNGLGTAHTELGNLEIRSRVLPEGPCAQ